jgi:sec-independent protein translocase protein TatA
MPSWIGPWEIAIVVIIGLLIFGPKKLPDLGSSLGKSITGFKRGLRDAQDEMKTAMKEDAETPASAEATVATTSTAALAAPAVTAGAAKDPVFAKAPVVGKEPVVTAAATTTVAEAASTEIS